MFRWGMFRWGMSRSRAVSALTLLAGVSLGCLLLSGASSAQESGASASTAQVNEQRVYAGRATGYRNLDQASLEEVSTPERIVAVTRSNVAPMEVWRALEHAEKVECLSCIPHVAKLLYNDDARTREISAWWLRRRIFGVFGPGEVYSQTVDTLNDATQSETRRAAAAEALGEFLTRAGVRHVAQAAIADSSAKVRLSAVRALQRLNSEGPAGELATAVADPDEQVRIAALSAAAKINRFTGAAAVIERLSDDSSTVRVRAVQALAQLQSRDAVPELLTLTDADNETNAEVRAAAVAALGRIGDSSAREALAQAQSSDPDRYVRNAARIALLRL
jgi:hypothetical protein